MNQTDIDRFVDHIYATYHDLLKDDIAEMLWQRYSVLHLAIWLRMSDERIEDAYLSWKMGLL